MQQVLTVTATMHYEILLLEETMQQLRWMNWWINSCHVSQYSVFDQSHGYVYSHLRLLPCRRRHRKWTCRHWASAWAHRPAPVPSVVALEKLLGPARWLPEFWCFFKIRFLSFVPLVMFVVLVFDVETTIFFLHVDPEKTCQVFKPHLINCRVNVWIGHLLSEVNAPTFPLWVVVWWSTQTPIEVKPAHD